MAVLDFKRCCRNRNKTFKCAGLNIRKRHVRCREKVFA